MAVAKGNTRITITMSNRNAQTLDEISQSLGITKASVISLALHDFIKKNFPEIPVSNERYKITDVPVE